MTDYPYPFTKRRPLDEIMATAEDTSARRFASESYGETHSFEISEYPCGSYGALLAAGFLLSFVATIGTLFLVL